MFYFFVNYILFANTLISRVQKTKLSVLSYIFLVLIIATLGLRWEIGGDWPNYIGRYYDVESILDHVALHRDPLYQLINNIFSLSGFEYPFFNFATSLWLILPYYLLLKKIKYKELALLILFSYVLLIVNPGYVRQSFSIAIFVFLALSYHKLAITTLIILSVAATLFHKSGIITVLFLILSVNSTIARLALFIVVALAMGLQFAEILLNKATDYLAAERSTTGAIIRLMFLASSAIFYYCMKLLNLIAVDPQMEKFMNYAASIIICLCFVAFFSATFADRFSLYFLFTIPLVIDYFLQKTRSTVGYLAIAVAFSCWVPIWVMFANNADDWLPFQISFTWL